MSLVNKVSVSKTRNRDKKKLFVTVNLEVGSNIFELQRLYRQDAKKVYITSYKTPAM